MIKTI